MSDNEFAIRVEGVSKVFRIGMKEEVHANLGNALIDVIKSPLKNYRKYRSLYDFSDIDENKDQYLNDEGILWALRDVSFDVKPGEVVGIIGMNGAGKSTLLKILSRITPPSSGRIELHGRISSLLEVGTGFHQELTGRENIYLNGTILGMRKYEIDKIFDEIVSFSGVEKFLDTPIKRYSSGMKVRLAFSVAAHLEPEILIIDEVLAVGDADFQRKCLKKMEEVGHCGRTVLFVSHSMPAVTRLCGRAILLNQGMVICDGHTHDVVSSYLGSGQGLSSMREWPDTATAPGGKIARLRAIRIKTENEAATSNAINITEPVAVEMEYDVLESGHALMPHFHLFNDEGVHVFVSIDQDPQWRHLKPRPAGRYISTAWIPGNFLSEGTMYVSPALNSLRPNEQQFYLPDVIAFQVVDDMSGNSARGDYASRLGGVVRPMLKWTTERYPESQHIMEKSIKNVKV